MNPADLFTKHLVSRDRVDSLVKLFGCEYRDGRPDGAPLLRRSDTEVDHDQPHDDDDDDLMPVVNKDESEYVEVPEAGLHDINILPHMHGGSEVEKLFPMAQVQEDDEANNYDDYVPDYREVLYGPWGDPESCGRPSSVFRNQDQRERSHVSRVSGDKDALRIIDTNARRQASHSASSFP